MKPEIGQLWRSKFSGRIYRVLGKSDLLGRDDQGWIVGLIEDDGNDHDPWTLWATMEWFEEADLVDPGPEKPAVSTRWPALTDLLTEELDTLERLLAMYREGKHAGDRFIEKSPLYHIAKGQRHTAAWFLSDHESADTESEEPILAHVAARALFALACEQRGKR